MCHINRIEPVRVKGLAHLIDLVYVIKRCSAGKVSILRSRMVRRGSTSEAAEKTMNILKRQCAACPWKITTVPERDIPGGYCPTKHQNIKNTVAEPGRFHNTGTFSTMACHETSVGREQACTGWVNHQLGSGNNIALRLYAFGNPEAFAGLELDVEQHETFEATLPTRRQRGRGL